MPRVLLADDDIELCALLSDYLTGEGFEVDAVYDGETATRSAREQGAKLDIVIGQQNPGHSSS